MRDEYVPFDWAQDLRFSAIFLPFLWQFVLYLTLVKYTMKISAFLWQKLARDDAEETEARQKSKCKQQNDSATFTMKI